MDHFQKHASQLGNGLTYDLWRECPYTDIFVNGDTNVGYGVKPDLVSFDSAVDAAAATVRYAPGARIYIDTSCTVQQLTHALGGTGGGIRLSTTTTDNVEAWIQWCGASGSPFLLSDTAAEIRSLWFETAFRVSTVTDDKCGFFIGLAEEGLAAADTIADAGTLADKDYIGFHRLEGDGDTLDFVYNKASGGGAVTKKADWKTIAADTWYHVGMHFDQRNLKITPWFGTGDRTTTTMAPDVDNAVTAANISGTNFPDSEGLAPLIGIKNATNVAYTLDIRTLACAQLAPAAS